MKVLALGTITGVTGGTFASGVSSPPIDISAERRSAPVGIWCSIEGDLGRTGGSVAVFWKASPSRSGTSYACLDPTNVTVYVKDTTNYQYVVKSGTSKTGFFENGCYTRVLECPFPWIRLQAVASKAGATNHGSATTNTCTVKYGVCAV